MGVRLQAFLKKYAPEAFSNIHTIEDYAGKTITFDASEIIYRFCRAIIGNSGDGVFVDSGGNPTIHLYAMMSVISACASYKIKPVIVFDGKPPDIKRKTLEIRNKKVVQAEQQLEYAETDDEINDATKKMFRIKSYMIDECKQLLNYLCIPYVQAPEEADSQCAALGRYVKSIYGVAVEDNDSFPFGTPIVLKDFKKNGKITEISLDIILKQLDIDLSRLIDICILASGDYCVTIRNVGATIAYETLQWVKDNKIDIDLKLASLSYLRDNIDIDFLSAVFPNEDIVDVDTMRDVYIQKIVNDERFRTMIMIVQKIHDDNHTKYNGVRYKIPDQFLYEYIVTKLYYSEKANVEDPREVEKRWDLDHTFSYFKNMNLDAAYRFLTTKGFDHHRVSTFIDIVRGYVSPTGRNFSTWQPPRSCSVQCNLPAAFVSSRRRQNRLRVSAK